MTLKNPRLPCIRVGSKQSKRKKLFPMELCGLPNDQKVKKLTEQNVADLIKKTVMPGKNLSAITY